MQQVKFKTHDNQSSSDYSAGLPKEDLHEFGEFELSSSRNLVLWFDKTSPRVHTTKCAVSEIRGNMLPECAAKTGLVIEP